MAHGLFRLLPPYLSIRAMPSSPAVASLGTGFIIFSIAFILGSIYANWAYDYYLLWVSPTPPEMIAAALSHYRTKALQPTFLHHVLHAVMAIGMVGTFIKLYKPTESNTLMDGGTLTLLFIGTVFYITNMRPAGVSLITGDWNDIDEETGIKFVAATQVIIVFALLGALGLQAGQWWAERDIARQEALIQAEINAENAVQEELEEAMEAAVEETVREIEEVAEIAAVAEDLAMLEQETAANATSSRPIRSTRSTRRRK